MAIAPPALADLLRSEQGIIERLARAQRVHMPSGSDGRPTHSVSRRVGSVEVLLPVDEAFVAKERAALGKEIDRARAEAEAIQRKLATNFVDKAPPAVVAKERAKLDELRQTLTLSEQRLTSLK